MAAPMMVAPHLIAAGAADAGDAERRRRPIPEIIANRVIMHP
jgi:hypothetical protein